MNISAIHLSAMRDEFQKIAGGGIQKALMTNITPGDGPILRRLGRGFRNVGSTLRNQVKRHGIRGLT